MDFTRNFIRRGGEKMKKNMIRFFLVGIIFSLTIIIPILVGKNIKKMELLESNYVFLTERFLRFENGYNKSTDNFEKNLTFYSSKINALILANNLEKEIGCIVRWKKTYMPEDLRGDILKEIPCEKNGCLGKAKYKSSKLGILVKSIDEKYVYVVQNDYQCPICKNWIFEKTAESKFYEDEMDFVAMFPKNP